mgnify:CR=1 FL=1
MLTTLDAADVPAALTRPITDLSTHPQLDTWCDVRVPGGTARMLPPPVAGFEWSPGAVPALGEHNREILRDLGIALHRELGDHQHRAARAIFEAAAEASIKNR